VSAGARFLSQGDPVRAEKSWRRATEIDKNCKLAWFHLTDFLEQAQRIPEALECLSQSIATAEPTATNLFNLGKKSCILGQFAQGRRLLREAAQLDPSLKTQAKLAIARADWSERDFEAAILAANEILAADPENLEALEVRHNCWSSIGWIPEEVADHRRYLQIRPDCEKHSRMLFKLNYLAEMTPEILYEESRRWNDLYAAPLASQILPHKNSPDPNRRLKIGYLSPDFKRHSVMKFLAPVLEHHDHQNFEIFGYYLDNKRDELTEFARRSVDHFVELPANRNVIAKRVRTDSIDILVDLAGHTMHTDAYMVFALKPAPLQVSWLGALATTGLSTMDYFIGGPHMPCPGTEHLFSEKVYRLPRPNFCYRPAADPGISQSPFFKNGFITFGCFNDPKKITAEVIKLWAVILHIHRDAKLLLKYLHFEREITQRRICQLLTGYGVSPDRIRFEGQSPNVAYMASWNQVDIALDPFPYNGGTTTLDAVWMGVPVISLKGRLTLSTDGANILSSIGLPVATSPEEYVGLANQFVQLIPTTPGIREHIRDSFSKSDIRDESGFVRTLENAYREMWHNWCAATDAQVIPIVATSR